MKANPVYVEAYAVPDSTAPAWSPPAEASPSSFLNVRTNQAGAREFLSGCRWPVGLQDTVIKNLNKIPYRIFICDDSGSMAASDGHRLIGTTPQEMTFVQCSRWTELACSLQFHANLSLAANATSQFRLLNGGPPIVIGNANDPENRNKHQTFLALMESTPSGGTPLCKHIREVIAEIKTIEAELRARSQKVCIIIMTDGESSDGDLAAAMQELKTLPVWTVVRLCTDEEKVVKYWNNIDNVLELDMDVLDDLAGEAEEVCENNPWLTYGEPLHRLREFGIPAKEIDLLDEQKLTLDQVRTFAAMLFGGRPDDYPHPDATSRKAYVLALEDQIKKTTNTWDPIRKRAAPWINVRKLPPGGKGGDGCNVS